MSTPGAASPFQGWQWAEIVVLMVVTVALILVQLLVGNLVLALFIGLAQLAVLVHIATWVIPMLRNDAKGGSR